MSGTVDPTSVFTFESGPGDRIREVRAVQTADGRVVLRQLGDDESTLELSLGVKHESTGNRSVDEVAREFFGLPAEGPVWIWNSSQKTFQRFERAPDEDGRAQWQTVKADPELEATCAWLDAVRLKGSGQPSPGPADV